MCVVVVGDDDVVVGDFVVGGGAHHGDDNIRLEARVVQVQIGSVHAVRYTMRVWMAAIYVLLAVRRCMRQHH